MKELNTRASAAGLLILEISEYAKKKFVADYGYPKRTIGQVGVFFLGAMEKQAIHNLKIVEDISSLYEATKHVFEDKLGMRRHLRTLDFIFGNAYSATTNSPSSAAYRNPRRRNSPAS